MSRPQPRASRGGRADPGELKLGRLSAVSASVASNAVSRLIARAYEDRFGLTVPQWRLICVLAEDGGLTQGGSSPARAWTR